MTFLNDDLAPADADEQAEAMAHDALVYELSVLLMRLDGNDGDPHQLVWCGGPIPEPWGDVWQKYEPQALSVVDAIGEASARAMVDALLKTIPFPAPVAATPSSADQTVSGDHMQGNGNG